MTTDEDPAPQFLEKLVRDYIHRMPDPRYGGSFRQAAAAEMPTLLCRKLIEEAKELRSNNNTEEAADVKEVLITIPKRFGFSFKRVQKMRRQKFTGPYLQLLDQLVDYAYRFEKNPYLEAYADLIEIGALIERSSPVFTPDRIEQIRKMKLLEKGGFHEGWVWIPDSQVIQP